MSFKYKLVGNLVFNQEDGEIYHAKTAETLVKYPVQLVIPVHLLAKSVEIAIDSTGEKETCGHFKLTSELLKHLKEAYFEVLADDPTATDAVVDVHLWNWTDASSIVKVSFSGAGGFKPSSNIADTLKTLANKVVNGRIYVSTASATSGAKQVFRSIVLKLIYDFTK